MPRKKPPCPQEITSEKDSKSFVSDSIFRRLKFDHSSKQPVLNKRIKQSHFCLHFQKYHDLLSNVTL